MLISSYLLSWAVIMMEDIFRLTSSFLFFSFSSRSHLFLYCRHTSSIVRLCKMGAALSQMEDLFINANRVTFKQLLINNQVGLALLLTYVLPAASTRHVLIL